MSNDPQTQTGQRESRTSNSLRQNAAASATLLLLLAATLLLLRLGPGRAWFDAERYHMPAIRTFAQQLPTPDLTNYLSATTPGYHLTIAAAVRTLGLSEITVLATSLLFSIALFAIFGAALARAGASIRQTLLFTAPAAASAYIIAPAVTPIPDNAGWLTVAATLWFATARNWTTTRYLCIAATLALVVFFRQSHIWVAAVIAAAAWIDAPTKPNAASPQADSDYPGLGLRRLLAEPASRIRPTLLVAAATIPAILILAAFIKVWGGLVPPMFQTALINDQFSHANTQGINLSTPLFLLAQIGIITFFFAGYLWPRVRSFDRVLRNRVIASAALIAIASLILPTTFSVPEGRYGGWWQLAKLTPTLAHIAPLLVIMATFGAAATTAWALALPYRARWLAIAALAAFTAAQTANANAWQRYHEPLLIMGLAVLAIQAFNVSKTTTKSARQNIQTHTLLPRIDRAMQAWRWLGPAAFTALLTFISLGTEWQRPPQDWIHFEPEIQIKTTQIADRSTRSSPKPPRDRHTTTTTIKPPVPAIHHAPQYTTSPTPPNSRPRSAESTPPFSRANAPYTLNPPPH